MAGKIRERANAQARKVQRFVRAFGRAHLQEFGEPYRLDLETDAAFLIHHVLRDCCGRVEWAIAQAGRMLEDPQSKAGSFRDLWIGWHLRGMRVPPSRVKREASNLRAMARESAAVVCDRVALPLRRSA